MPKVSVIIPTYNRSKLVKEAVESVLAQSYTDFEILVIDDGSTDDTRSVIEQIPDSRIRYYYKENSGCSGARNFGLVRAKGEYIAYLDSDDLWPENYLETVLKAFAENNDYGAVYGRAICIRPNGEKKEFGSSKRNVSGWITKSYFSYKPFLIPSVTCFRSHVWKDVFWDEKMKRISDYDVFLRISTKTKFLFVPDAYVIYRPQADSISLGKSPMGVINAALSLERFYFHLGGDKYVSLYLAKRKISHRYRKAGKVCQANGNKSAAILLFKRAISYNPFDPRLYWDMVKVLLLNSKNDKMPGWQMPESLPNEITVNGERALSNVKRS